MRFFLWGLLIVIAAIAAMLGVGRVAYDALYIPRRPLSFHSRSASEIEMLSPADNHLIVVTGEWSASGCFRWWQAFGETPHLRRRVHREAIQCWHLDVTEEAEYVRWTEYCSTHLSNDLRCTPPCVVTIFRGKVALEPADFNGAK